MIDLCDLLIKKKCEMDVLEINKNGLFEQFLHDWRFMVLYYQCIKEVSTVESIMYIKKVILLVVLNLGRLISYGLEDIDLITL